MKSLVSLSFIVLFSSCSVGHPTRESLNQTVEQYYYAVPGHNESEKNQDLLVQNHTYFPNSSNNTNYDHLGNFRDFSGWNKEDIHEFDLNHENDILGNEFSYLDQLAVESGQNLATFVHNKSQANLTQNVQQDAASSKAGNVLFATNGPVNAEIFETQKTDQSDTNENKDPEVEDDTIRSQSVTVNRTQGIYGDTIRKVVADNGLHENNSNILDHENEVLLNKFQEKYEKDPNSVSTLFEAPRNDFERPLISIHKIDPYSVTVTVRPKTYESKTMQVRLMYERVPLSKAAIPQHLNDPVIEYVPIYRREQEHRLYNLPVGKYIVCGEAMSDGNVFQANCVEALIRKQGNRMLQGGVICVIAIAMLIVFSVIVYAIYHRLVIYKLDQKA